METSHPWNANSDTYRTVSQDRLRKEIVYLTALRGTFARKSKTFAPLDPKPHIEDSKPKKKARKDFIGSFDRNTLT